MKTLITTLQALTVLVIALVITGCVYVSQQPESQPDAPVTVQADANTCPHADSGKC